VCLSRRLRALCLMRLHVDSRLRLPTTNIHNPPSKTAFPYASEARRLFQARKSVQDNAPLMLETGGRWRICQEPKQIDATFRRRAGCCHVGENVQRNEGVEGKACEEND